jgi:hypothetical protein
MVVKSGVLDHGARDGVFVLADDTRPPRGHVCS